MTLQRKVVLYELNEVPYRVVDDYCAGRPDSNLSRLLRQHEKGRLKCVLRIMRVSQNTPTHSKH